MFGDNSCPPSCNTLGFLQKNNSLEEKGRLAGHKNLLSCDNSDRDARFRLTETDFSNLFARGERKGKSLISPTVAVYCVATLVVGSLVRITVSVADFNEINMFKASHRRKTSFGRAQLEAP